MPARELTHPSPSLSPDPSLVKRDITAVFGLGFTVLFGALQMSSCSSYVGPFIIIGAVIIGIATVHYVRCSPAATKLLKFISRVGIIALVSIAVDLAKEAYISSHLDGYVSLYERNREQWDKHPDNGGPNTPIALGPTLPPLRKKHQESPVLLTPVVGNKSLTDVISPGTDIFLTINGNGTQLDFRGPYTVWQPLNSFTQNGQTFRGVIEEPILPGRGAKGPNEFIQVKFPPEKYRIDYRIQGQSEKHCSFNAESYFFIEIY